MKTARTGRARRITGGLVLFVMICAGLLNSGFAGLRGLRYVAYLGRWEVFHVAAHLVIFGGLVLLVALWSPRKHLWFYGLVALLLATLLIEGIQILTVDHTFGVALLAASAYDLAVNLVGGSIGLLLAHRLFPRQTTDTPTP